MNLESGVMLLLCLLLLAYLFWALLRPESF
jgi:K+-transporting ATPase KdpF subunit